MKDLDSICEENGFSAPAWSGVGDGWLGLVEEMIIELKSSGFDGEILQIKEKFGTLRVYLSEIHEEADAIVRRAEHKSAHICESCGKPGELRGPRWFTTLCEEHYALIARKEV